MTRVAMLAPVPELHLRSGLETINAEGKVAFGSSAWETFRDLDKLRNGHGVHVYIYASHSEKYGAPKIRWKARYIGHVSSIGGAHPDGMKYRPATTANNFADNASHWAIFWEIEQLTQLSRAEAIPISAFNSFASDKPYVSSFIPHGPTLVREL